MLPVTCYYRRVRLVYFLQFNCLFSIFFFFGGGTENFILIISYKLVQTSALGNILGGVKCPKEPRKELILPQKYGFFPNFTHYVDVFNYLSWFLVKALVTLIRIMVL